MGTPLHIALRYLFAKKRHNVINIISIVSAAGIAIGSMALILVLSVYNGFDNSIREIYESYKADFVISPINGKTLHVEPHTIEALHNIGGIAEALPTISENIFVKYGNKEAIATLVGADSLWYVYNGQQGNIREGSLTLQMGENKYAIVETGIAAELGIRVRFITPLMAYFPKKGGDISLVNPHESINGTKLFVSAIIQGHDNIRGNRVYVSTENARELTSRQENEYTSIDIFLNPNADTETVRRDLRTYFPECNIKNKEEQNATLYKMMKAERFAVYLILFFIIGIISINIFSCLSMLVADKSDDIATFASMGATKIFIANIFHLHGFLISLLGCVTGIMVGLIAAFIQQQYGIVSLPGNYIFTAYPVDIELTDVAITFLGVTLIGFIISYLPAKKIFKN